MTKQELASEVAAKVDGCSAQMAAETLAAAVEIIKETVAHGGEVTIRGFGTFKNQFKAAKTARNISTGEQIMIAEHNVPAFKVSKEFKEMVK